MFKKGYYYFPLLRVFHSSVSGWFLPAVSFLFPSVPVPVPIYDDCTECTNLIGITINFIFHSSLLKQRSRLLS